MNKREKEKIEQEADGNYGLKKNIFTKEMKNDYTILCPLMAPIHFEMLEAAVQASGYKIKLLRDSLKSMKYILESCVYYNPLKIFTSLSIVCIILSIIGFLFSHFANIKAGYILGIGGLLLSLSDLVFLVVASYIAYKINGTA